MNTQPTTTTHVHPARRASTRLSLLRFELYLLTLLLALITLILAAVVIGTQKRNCEYSTPRLSSTQATN